MLGILFIIFIGKYFYKLAEEFRQNKWLYAILGIVIYYAGTAVAGVILGLMDAFFGLDIDWDNTILMSIVALPFGIGACVLVYYLLRKKWQREYVIPEDEILKIGNDESDL
ncbi:MAG: hypothetical protein CFE23_01535 [Flavobacterium sp. BFFFF1]|uniref:hypothetical protein n=1 Tax=unclassified Flavobacterium TaxID=196869 RepID=UPI000BDC3F25|nr:MULTISPECIES: hypothetical protein [unclassified Flavobacterium]OYU82011.1 MAG: hypothetical protein CFE23_01535 [Flavobacterium sp. BFFFF1]